MKNTMRPALRLNSTYRFGAAWQDFFEDGDEVVLSRTKEEARAYARQMRIDFPWCKSDVVIVALADGREKVIGRLKPRKSAKEKP